MLHDASMWCARRVATAGRMHRGFWCSRLFGCPWQCRPVAERKQRSCGIRWGEARAVALTNGIGTRHIDVHVLARVFLGEAA